MRYLLKDDHHAAQAAPQALRPACVTDMRFRKCLPPEAWDALPAAVQARFSKKVAPGESSVYCGKIEHTRMNFAGRLMAFALRMVGAPLPLDAGNDGAPAIVSITDDAAGNGQFWVRQYGRPKGFPQVLHSTKRFAGPTGLEEYIGAGIGMTLNLRVDAGALWFESARYYLGGQKLRVYLPKWLSPGQLRVGHTDIGGGKFIFRLTLTHRLMGRMIDQSIQFNDPEIIR